MDSRSMVTVLGLAMVGFVVGLGAAFVLTPVWSLVEEATQIDFDGPNGPTPQAFLACGLACAVLANVLYRIAQRED